MNDEERELWRIGDLACVMISCCSGAELQLRQVRLRPAPSNGAGGTIEPDTTEDSRIVLREMYPMKSDLYERARGLRAEYDQKEPRRPQRSQRE